MIGPTGEKIGVLPIEQALAKAQELGMNLVEVSPMEKPPVCKIMDYGRFKYEQKKKANESKKKQAVVHLKEIKLRPKTEEHDYDFKVKAVRAFLQEGNKARITIMFRGREITHRDIGQRILQEVVEDVRDCGIVEQQPRLEGRQMFMILSPNPKWKPGTPPPPPRKHSIAEAIAGIRKPMGNTMGAPAAAPATAAPAPGATTPAAAAPAPSTAPASTAPSTAPAPVGVPAVAPAAPPAAAAAPPSGPKP